MAPSTHKTSEHARKDNHNMILSTNPAITEGQVNFETSNMEETILCAPVNTAQPPKAAELMQPSNSLKLQLHTMDQVEDFHDVG